MRKFRFVLFSSWRKICSKRMECNARLIQASLFVKFFWGSRTFFDCPRGMELLYLSPRDFTFEKTPRCCPTNFSTRDKFWKWSLRTKYIYINYKISNSYAITECFINSNETASSLMQMLHTAHPFISISARNMIFSTPREFWRVKADI